MSVVRGKLEAVSNFHTDGISTATKVDFVFNPAKLGVGATAKWEQPAASGNKKAGPPQFKGADPVTVDLELVLDGWEERNKGREILDDVNTLISWTRPTAATRTSKKPSPPIVRLNWGTPWFECYVTTVKVSYTMFDQTGKPVRATVTVNLKELGTTPPKQNPTSGSLAGHQSHMVVEGDSLPLLAHRYYEKAEYWRGVAIANNIDDPQRILPGTRILLPPLEDVAALSA